MNQSRVNELQKMVDELGEVYPLMKASRSRIINDLDFRENTPRELAKIARAMLRDTKAYIRKGRLKRAAQWVGVSVGLMWWMHVYDGRIKHYQKVVWWFWEEATQAIQSLWDETYK